MGWFENQIEERRKADQQLLEDSFVRIAGVVLGERRAEEMNDDRIITKNAIDEILKYYHCKPAPLPESMLDMGAEEQMNFLLEPHGLMWRDVELTKGWYKDSYGPVLAFYEGSGAPVVLFPGKIGGYYFRDLKTGKDVRLKKSNEALFADEAICFYRPLPLKKLGIYDLLLYMKQCISLSDMIFIISAALAAAFVGLFIPRMIRILTGSVLTGGKVSALIGIAVCLLCFSFSGQLLNAVKALLTGKLKTKLSLGVQASMMMRIMYLPASFFRDYSAGELKSRSMSVNRLCELLSEIVFTVGLTSFGSLLYVTQIFSFAPSLAAPSLCIVFLTVGFSFLVTVIRVRITRRTMEQEAKESGMSYAMISGIQKIKLAGAEKRIFAKWLNLYAKGAELVYNPPAFLKGSTAVSTGITLLSDIVLYFVAAKNGLNASDYFAFMAAYGALMGAFGMIGSVCAEAAQIKPILEMAEPFLRTEPEISAGKEIVTEISGGVELEHVYFRYSEETPYILNDLSLKVRPGEYVAIVGETGCGKSTLVRLLLGFEKPEKGAVYYDGKDLQNLDPGSLRKKIGTVMQQSGLFQGDIYSNIVISAPELGISKAWEAAEIAGIADDIREMPMGMSTLISEGGGGISGGQKQRLMIARAIAPGPKLLIFDEATSALDNKTQRQVTEALDGLGCTRIVIAHRLSTIRHCDRILVLDGGRIAEDGSYEELIGKKGIFAELVERQRINQS